MTSPTPTGAVLEAPPGQAPLTKAEAETSTRLFRSLPFGERPGGRRRRLGDAVARVGTVSAPLLAARAAGRLAAAASPLQRRPRARRSPAARPARVDRRCRRRCDGVDVRRQACTTTRARSRRRSRDPPTAARGGTVAIPGSRRPHRGRAGPIRELHEPGPSILDLPVCVDSPMATLGADGVATVRALGRGPSRHADARALGRTRRRPRDGRRSGGTRRRGR